MEIEKEMMRLILENNLDPFNLYKTPVKNSGENIFKTKDGKIVYNKLLNKISNYFCFSDTSNILNVFGFTQDFLKIKERQEFFKKIPKNIDNPFLKELKKPKATWKPKYGIVVVTDDEDTFTKLNNLDVPVKYLINEDDVSDLENYDIVQVVEVEQFGIALEQLPQSVFLDSVDDVYLERYLEQISGWSENFKVLEKIDNEEVRKIIEELKPLLELISLKGKEKLNRNFIEDNLEKINDEISSAMKNLNISGDSLFKMLSMNKLPEEIEKIIYDSIKRTNIPEHIFETVIPVKIDESELESFIKLQDANENTDFAEKIKKNSKVLKEVPKKIERLSMLLLIHDFISGISRFISDIQRISMTINSLSVQLKNNEFKNNQLNTDEWPEFSSELVLDNGLNIFLENPKPIRFYLNENEKCSILTGANSGGKTTLIEHIIQIIGLANIGLPVIGLKKTPIFSEVYYFAKNKGSANKGAFETLLTQMSEIKPGKQTLILADEIEAVTEPGVAGKIISATSRFFIEKNCFLIIATHLGQEIIKVLPLRARIDGIEAKGLDENNELIVDHNPVLGRIANSTPELIVEKMANSNKHEYFLFVNEYLKKNGG